MELAFYGGGGLGLVLVVVLILVCLEDSEPPTDSETFGCRNASQSTPFF